MQETIKDSTIYKKADKKAQLIMLNEEAKALEAGKQYWCAKWQVFEIYTIGGPNMIRGWDIKWIVCSGTMQHAKENLKSFSNFDCIISCNDYNGGDIIGHI